MEWQGVREGEGGSGVCLHVCLTPIQLRTKSHNQSAKRRERGEGHSGCSEGSEEERSEETASSQFYHFAPCLPERFERTAPNLARLFLLQPVCVNMLDWFMLNLQQFRKQKQGIHIMNIANLFCSISVLSLRMILAIFPAAPSGPLSLSLCHDV